MRRYELQRRIRPNTEDWKKMITWDKLEPLLTVMTEGYRVVDRTTGTEIMRYEAGEIKYKSEAAIIPFEKAGPARRTNLSS